MPNYSKTFWKLGNRDNLVWSALTIWTDFAYIHTQIHKEEEKKEYNNPIWMWLNCGPLLPSSQNLNLANGYTKKKRKKTTHISVWCFGTLCFLLLRLRSAMTVISRAKTTFSYTPVPHLHFHLGGNPALFSSLGFSSKYASQFLLLEASLVSQSSSSNIVLCWVNFAALAHILLGESLIRCPFPGLRPARLEF